MVEVFKTSVKEQKEAEALISLIHDTFADLMANFDLDDCDNILRVQSINSEIQPDKLIRLLKAEGHTAEVLPDIVPSFGHPIFRSLYREKN